MAHWNNYHLAQSVEDALAALRAAQGPARLVAGGSDLLLDIQQGRHPPVDVLVDVTAIPEMNQIEIREERLFVGAAVPLNRIVASTLVAQHAQALVEACGLIGGPQVRNTATLGGNVAHALPAGDGTIALAALDARAIVASAAGPREVPLLELFLGPGRSALRPAEDLLVGFYLNLRQPGQGSAHRRVMRPQGVAIAILNMAVWVQRQGDQIEDLHIALGPAGPTPQRATAAEACLRGQSFRPDGLEAAVTALLDQIRFRTSPHRSTAEYRRHLSGVLLQETLSLAWQRAGMFTGSF